MLSDKSSTSFMLNEFYSRVWDVHTGTPLNVLVHHVEAVLHLRFQNGMMVTWYKFFVLNE